MTADTLSGPGSSLVILGYRPGAYLPQVAYRGQPLAPYKVEQILRQIAEVGARPKIMLDGKHVGSMMVYRGRTKRLALHGLYAGESEGGILVLEGPQTLTDEVMQVVFDLADSITDRVRINWPEFYAQLNGSVLSGGRVLSVPIPVPFEVQQIITRGVRLRRRRQAKARQKRQENLSA